MLSLILALSLQSQEPTRSDLIAQSMARLRESRHLVQTCVRPPANLTQAKADRAAGKHQPNVAYLVHYEMARAAGLPHCEGE